MVSRAVTDRDAWAETTALLRARGAGLGAAVALVLVWSALSAPEDVGTPLFTGGALLALIALHGIVAGDLRSGTAFLWLQKPVSPLDFYLTRLLLRGVVVALLILGLFATVHVLVLARGTAGEANVIDALPATVLVVVPTACVLFGFSGLGVYPDSLAAVVVVALLAPFVLVGLDRQDPGVLVRIAAFPLAFPYDQIRDLGRAIGGEPSLASVLDSALYLGGYALLWLGVGLAGLYLNERALAPGDTSR